MLELLLSRGDVGGLEKALRSADFDREELSRALMQSIDCEGPGVASLLLENGADPCRIPDGYRYPLLSVVEAERADLVEVFVSYGADVNYRDESGWTPLHLAVDVEADVARQTGRPRTGELTRVLLRLGADPGLADNAGRSPLDLARKYGHREAAELLSAGRGSREAGST